MTQKFIRDVILMIWDYLRTKYPTQVNLGPGQGAVLPVNMLEGLFTIVAVDNIDKNARSTISTIIINTHATAMALVQYRDGQNQSREKQLKPL